MRWDWPGARERCTYRVPKAAKQPRPPFMVHREECDLDHDCTCPESCVYCAGSGEAFDPTTGEGPTCPACGGTGLDLAPPGAGE